MKLGLNQEEMDELLVNNGLLPEGVRLSEVDMEELQGERITLGLLVRARRALSFIANKGGSNTNFVLKEQLKFFATRSEILVIEDTLESQGHMLLGIFEALKANGIITEADLIAALKRTAEGKVLEVRDGSIQDRSG